MKRLFVCENCGKIFMERTDGTVRAVFGYDMCSDQCANEFMNRKKGKPEMSENYIVINGKKAEMTEEQLKQLGIEPEKKRKNPFARARFGEKYYYINRFGHVHDTPDTNYSTDIDAYDNANYFRDEAFANQVALHQLLYRKLLKFAWDNGYEDTPEWGGDNCHWCIYYSYNNKRFEVGPWGNYKQRDVYFSSREGAERAFKKVVEPFIKEHPEFVW